MLLQMRQFSRGSSSWLDGMHRIFRQGPSGARNGDGALKGAEFHKLVQAASDEFFEFERLASHIVTTARAAQSSSSTENYRRLSGVVEAEVLGATMARSSSGIDVAEVEQWMAETIRPRRPNVTVLSHGQLFVHLPLTMYVQDTLHLYEMLARLNSDVARGMPGATGPGDNVPAVFRLRAVLDQGYQPYSWLVFAIMGALQVLFRAREKLGQEFEGLLLSLLASTPASVAYPKTYRELSSEEHFGLGLMFRGLWVTPVVDEDRAHHQYSFNSFARTLDGAVFVLNQYATVLPVAQRADWHVLICIGRGWTDNPWILPVQLFAGPGFGEFEKELMTPPFMSLEFDEDLELQSDMPPLELERRASAALRWLGVPFKRSEGRPLGALAAVLGPEFLPLLGQAPGLFKTSADEMAPEEHRPGPKATVRFIASLEPRPAIRSLFEQDDKFLLAFPAQEHAGSRDLPRCRSTGALRQTPSV